MLNPLHKEDYSLTFLKMTSSASLGSFNCLCNAKYPQMLSHLSL